MFGQLNAARATNSYDRRITALAKVDLLIIDDFGLKPLRSPQDEDFHDLIAERYERKGTIITSNLDLSEWGDAFPNKLLGAATIDRIRHGAYNVILEGVWFYSGFMVALSFRQRNLLRNFGSLMDWVVRDESLHLKFGINLILTVLEENPDLQTEEFAAEIKQMILDAVEMEEAYNNDLLPGGILGLNASYINQYVKYLADRRLEELGFDPEYNVTNPAKWMAAANDTLQLVNFFESTNTSYESNASASSGHKS